MKDRLLALLPTAVVAAFVATACGSSEVTPPSAAPRDVIAFAALESGDEPGYAIYLARPDGSDLRKLTDATDVISFLRWSPTGDRIAYIVGAEEERPGRLLVYDFRTGQAITVSEGATASRLGPAVSWSPDGRRLAFVEAIAGGGTRIFDVERGELIATGEIPGASPDWSPAQDEIAVIVPDGSAGDTNLYLVDADGENLRRLVDRPGAEGNPRWSPDGRLLAFWSSPEDQPDARQLLVVERESGRLTELEPGYAAAWSPDGERLAYAGPAASGNAANLDIFLVAADGGDLRRLSESVTVDRWPSWSPTGDRLAYLAQVDRQTAFVCVVQLEPEDRDCLPLPDHLLPGAPAWSPQ